MGLDRRIVLLGLYVLLVAGRGLRIASCAATATARCWRPVSPSGSASRPLINIGSVSGSIPFTGVPLPFVSYGGTSLTITLAAVGLLLNISRFAYARPAPAATAAPDANGAGNTGWRARLSQLGRRGRPTARAPRS